MPLLKTNCKNCEKPFYDAFEYCPNCGQKVKDDLTLGVLFSNTISNYFSVDARFFRSFIPLLIKPGYLAEKFVAGKRLLYLHPAQLYLFISVVFFFIFSFQVTKQERAITTAMQADNDVKKAAKFATSQKDKDAISKAIFLEKMKENQKALGIKDEELHKLDSITTKEGYSRSNNMSFDFNEEKIDSLIAINASDAIIYKEMGLSKDAGFIKRKFYNQALRLYKDNGSIANIVKKGYDTIPIALFVLLPIFALLLKLLHYKKGRYAHHLVFSFYFFSFLFTVFSILVLGDLLFDMPWWITSLVSLSTFLYLFLAIKRFYKQGWFLSLFKSGVVTFVYFVFVIPTAATIIVLFAFMFY